jgi:hypothetical protein
MLEYSWVGRKRHFPKVNDRAMMNMVRIEKMKYSFVEGIAIFGYTVK